MTLIKIDPSCPPTHKLRAQHPEWLAMMAHRARHPVPGHARRLHYLAREGQDAWASLPTIQTPTLVILGQADDINPGTNGALLAQQTPGTQRQVLPAARHGYFWQARAEASQRVIDFLKAVEARPVA